MSAGSIVTGHPPIGLLRRAVVAIWKRRRLVATFGVIGLGLAATGNEYTMSMARALDRVQHGSQLVSTRFGNLEYADAGIGAPILMIHGSGGGFDQGLNFSRRLIDGGFRVIAPSRFGYLRSDFPADASPEAQADAFVELLDELKLDRVAVVGGSAGALSAVQFAIRHPERCSALILLVPLGYVPSRAQQAPSPITDAIMGAALKSDFLFWLGLNVAPDLIISSILATDPQLVREATASEQERVSLILEGILPVSSRAEGLLNDGRLAQSLEPVALDKIKAPTLAISLADDRYGTLASAAHIAANVAHGRLIVYQTGGHLWVGHDAEIFDQISEFVRNGAVADH